MFLAVIQNSYKIIKLIIDAAKADSHVFECQFTFEQQKFAQMALKLKTKKFASYLDGLDLLQLAVYAQASECIRLLTPQFPQSELNGFTPLMMCAQMDVSIDKKAITTLTEQFSGRFLKKEQNMLPEGTTALMIACGLNVDNITLI